MHFLNMLGAIMAIHTLNTSANPIASPAGALEALEKRACADACPANSGAQPLARLLGKPCGLGICDKTYSEGDETCSCNRGAIVSSAACNYDASIQGGKG